MQIEKHIPMPSTLRPGAPTKYHFEEMEIGDSIFDAGATCAGKIKGGSKIYMAAYMHGKRHGKKFTGRKIEGGVRIWRVS